MTATEAKALALELRTHAGGLYADMTQSRLWSALVLAADHIERLEAAKARHAAEMRELKERFEAFRQEVSDELAKLGCWPDTVNLQRFILPKPDPLVEVCREIGLAPYRPDELRAAIEKRGGKIVWGEG